LCTCFSSLFCFFSSNRNDTYLYHYYCLLLGLSLLTHCCCWTSFLGCLAVELEWLSLLGLCLLAPKFQFPLELGPFEVPLTCFPDSIAGGSLCRSTSSGSWLSWSRALEPIVEDTYRATANTTDTMRITPWKHFCVLWKKSNYKFDC
jgi:hypothetical protein